MWLCLPRPDRYLGPTVSAVSGQGTFQAKTDGGQVVLISGSEFGSAGDTVGKVVVTYGPPHSPSRFVARGCHVDFDFNGARGLQTLLRQPV